LEALGVTRTFGAQVMLAEPFGDLGLREHSVKEPLPHRLPPVTLASLRVEVRLSFAVAKQKRRDVQWPRGPGAFDRGTQLWRSVVDDLLAGASLGLMWRDVNPVLPAVDHPQSKQVTSTHAGEKLEPDIG